MPEFIMPLGDHTTEYAIQFQRGKIDGFTRGYIEAMFWTECNPDKEELEDATINDIAPETWSRILADCAKFQDDAKIVACIGDNYEQAGHDFWLTRNGHGAGFWDGDWPEPDASYLEARSDTFGNVDLYRGDDGLLYLA